MASSRKSEWQALLSTSNKTGLVDFAQQLATLGIRMIATGGTARLLLAHDIIVTEVEDYTGFPEILEGRVKTLHPKIYAGLLSRKNKDESVLDQHQIKPIQLLVVNLYPFQETIRQTDCTLEQAIEQIDIGGPAMIRAAAKNYHAVTVLTDPDDYPTVLEEIKQTGQTSPATRYALAQKAFAYTADYDIAIHRYLSQPSKVSLHNGEFPDYYQAIYRKHYDLRYGENPQQTAAFYIDPANKVPNSLAEAKILQGKPLSFNNLLDSDTALNCVKALDPKIPGCVIVKHATPCGVAQADSLKRAYEQAVATDPTSAFGGILAFNQTLTEDVTQILLPQQFMEVVLAPIITTEALEVLKQKPNIRVLAYGSIEQPLEGQITTLHSIAGGILIQHSPIESLIPKESFSVVSLRHPTPEEMSDLLFAWQVVKFVKSNAIVYAKNLTTLGIGTGQTSRVFSAETAAIKAQQASLSLVGAVMASDAFFPFADGIEVAAAAGVQAVIQPGGSRRDAEVIAAANRANMAMVFTGTRYFRH